MIVVPDCPYCDQPLGGSIMNGLHGHCNDLLHEELAHQEEDGMKYSGVLNWRDSEGHCGTIGEFQDIEAPDKARAQKIVLDEFWDDRLDSACCIPEIVFNFQLGNHA